jgi:hypothetical protein
MNVTVDVWLRGDLVATTRSIEGVVPEPAAWTDDDVRLVLEGMLREMYRAKHPGADDQAVALRGLSWIVNPYDRGGVLVAIEITLGAAVAGPFDIEQRALEAMITRVITHSRVPPPTRTVH